MATKRKTQKQDVYAFPLPEGAYFSVPVVSPRSTSSGGAVAAVRKVVGIPEKTTYDEETARAVAAWQADHDLPATRVVDKTTWDAMFNS